jgi:hypothetical protein
VGDGPPPRGGGVLDARRNRALRSQGVVDGQDVQPAVPAQQAARKVVGVEVSDREAAAVEEHEQRRSRTPGS